MDNDSDLLNDLVKLSEIFKIGFTVVWDGSKLNQYMYNTSSYIVAYDTVVTIHTGHFKKYHNNNIPLSNKYIFGGWYDIDDDIYHIEICKSFSSLNRALEFARNKNQKYVFDMKTNENIKVT